MDPLTSALSPAEIALISSLLLRISAGRLVTDCIHCGSTVALTICVSDDNGNKGKPMARHPLCAFFRWYPQLVSRPLLMALLPPPKSSPTPPSSQPFASSSTRAFLPPPSSQPLASSSTHALLPPPSTQLPGKRQRKRGERCVGSFCARPRALRCGQDMCSRHCGELGGCHFHGFDVPEEDILIADNDAPFEFPLEQDVSNDVLENEELRLALNASLLELGLPLPGAADPMPSLHDIMSAPPPNTFVPELPSTLRPCASSSSPALHAPTSKPPRITQQMDPIWTADLRARAQQEAEQQRVEFRRKEMEREAKQRFVLHWYDSDDAPVLVEWVSKCPYYPQWQLADDPELIALLGENVQKIEVYEDRSNRWIPAGLSHTFSLESGCNIFIRRYGVSHCRDFQELLNISKQGTRPRHLRFNMIGERDAVRAKLKHKDTILMAEASNMPAQAKRQREESSEVETSTPTRPRLAIEADFDSRRATSLSPTPPPVSMQHDLDNHVEADFNSRRAISLSPTPSLSPNIPFSVSLTTSSSSTTLSCESEPLPTLCTRMPPSRQYTPAAARVQVPQYDPDSKRQVWPYGMYTVDMTAGFRQMDDKILRATYQQEELFKHVFGVTFVKATYHQNRKAWQTTNLDVLAEHESAGRTPTGLWSRYLAARREALGEQSKKSSRARSGRAK